MAPGSLVKGSFVWNNFKFNCSWPPSIQLLHLFLWTVACDCTLPCFPSALLSARAESWRRPSCFSFSCYLHSRATSAAPRKGSGSCIQHLPATHGFQSPPLTQSQVQTSQRRLRRLPPDIMLLQRSYLTWTKRSFWLLLKHTQKNPSQEGIRQVGIKPR